MFLKETQKHNPTVSSTHPVPSQMALGSEGGRNETRGGVQGAILSCPHGFCMTGFSRGTADGTGGTLLLQYVLLLSVILL